MKRFFSFVLVLFMIMAITPVGAVVAEGSNGYTAEEIDYMNYEFPKDAVILYQGEDGVVYQSKEQTARASDGNMVTKWIDAGGSTTGQMSIKNPHTLVNTTNGYFMVNSEYGPTTVRFLLTDGVNAIVVRDVEAESAAINGATFFSFKSHTSNLVVQYFVLKSSRNYGMLLACKLW